MYLQDRDFDDALNGWRAPALELPGSELVEVLVKGERQDLKYFPWNPRSRVIENLRRASRPESLVAIVELRRRLTPATTAAGIGAVATVLAASITGLVTCSVASQDRTECAADGRSDLADTTAGIQRADRQSLVEEKQMPGDVPDDAELERQEFRSGLQLLPLELEGKAMAEVPNGTYFFLTALGGHVWDGVLREGGSGRVEIHRDNNGKLWMVGFSKDRTFWCGEQDCEGTLYSNSCPALATYAQRLPYGIVFARIQDIRDIMSEECNTMALDLSSSEQVP